MDEKARERLKILRRRGNPGVAALVAEELPPEEAIAFVAPHDEGWARLIEARALIRLRRLDEAKRILDEVQGLPRGLAAIQSELKDYLDKPAGAALPDPGRLALKNWLICLRHWQNKRR